MVKVLDLLALTDDQIVKGYNFQIVMLELFEVCAFVWLVSRTKGPVLWYAVGAILAAIAIMTRIGVWWLAGAYAPEGERYAAWVFDLRPWLFFAIQVGVIGVCFMLRSALRVVFGRYWLAFPLFVALLLFLGGAHSKHWLPGI